MKKGRKRNDEKTFQDTIVTSTVEIYYPHSLYYGSIRMKHKQRLLPTETEMKEEVEKRLPFFKGKDYQVSIG